MGQQVQISGTGFITEILPLSDTYDTHVVGVQLSSLKRMVLIKDRSGSGELL